MTVLEKSLAENIQLFTPENITKELLHINRTYENYNKELISFLNNIDNLLIDLNEIYKEVYFKCMVKPSGSKFFSSYGYVMVNVARYLTTLKTHWSLYQQRFQSFLNKLKSNTTQFMTFTNL